nr:alkaline phosphatase family protein [Myxococcota bacterium]
RPGALGLLVLITSAAGCGFAEKAGDESRPRILIVGIDGASPRVAFPMMEEGRLPNLARIAAGGVSGPLRSVLPLYSPRIWNTIATGRQPRAHGIPAFVKSGEDGSKELYLSSDRKKPALWNILSAAGRSVGVVNWWTTYPPEKIDGVMVSDHFFPEQISMIKKTFKAERASEGALVHPESWIDEAQERLADREPLTPFEDFLLNNEALPHWVNHSILSQQFITDEAITRVALGVQADYRPDVMMVFLPGIDRISHWLWGNLEPVELYPPGLRPDAGEKQAGADALRDYYAFTDALIGRLVEGYGPDDLVLVISDHGFEAGVSLMLLTGKHDTPAALNGVLFARGRGIARGQPAGPVNVFEIAPSVLTFAGLPVARDMVAGPAPFLGASEPEWIASYDPMSIDRYPPGRSGNEEEIIEQLRALGYLEDDSDEKAHRTKEER